MFNRRNKPILNSASSCLQNLPNDVTLYAGNTA